MKNVLKNFSYQVGQTSSNTTLTSTEWAMRTNFFTGTRSRHGKATVQQIRG